MSARALIRQAGAAALALAFPVDCAGCGEADVVLCVSCRKALTASVIRRSVDGFPVCSALPFDGVAARVLRAVKEDGRTSLARALAPGLQAAILALAEPGAVTVTVPTSRPAMRRRGYRVADLLARRAGLSPWRALRVVRRTADQRSLGRAARAGSMCAVRPDLVRGRRVILVDDVVTTGATLSEAARALRAAGAEVVGAATVAATAGRRATSTGTDSGALENRREPTRDIRRTAD